MIPYLFANEIGAIRREYLDANFANATITFSVVAFGAKGDGVTDDTLSVQAAADFVSLMGGGVLYFPPGTYIINKNIKIASKTIVRGAGRSSTLKAKQGGGYVGANGASYALQTCQMLKNTNFGAAVLTDTDITVEYLSFDWGSVTIPGGGAHAISMRFVDNVTVQHCYFINGENATALLACKDTLTFNCRAVGQSNAFYDHWDGAGNGWVIACKGFTSVNISQGVQFTGTGSYNEPLESADFLVMGCTLEGVRNSVSNSASAVIFNANQAASSAARCRSIGNLVKTSDIGLCFQGVTGSHLSQGDTFDTVDKLPIFHNSDASGLPSNCRVLDAHLINCNHLPGNIALVILTGTRNRVERLKVTNTGAPAYLLIAWIPVSAVNCFLDIAEAPSGSGGGRVLHQSTTSRLVDNSDFYGDTNAWLTVASAATIAPTTARFFVSGAVAIVNITPPPQIALTGGCIDIVASGNFTWTAAGNIFVASGAAATVGRTYRFVYDPGLARWFPSNIV